MGSGELKKRRCFCAAFSYIIENHALGEGGKRSPMVIMKKGRKEFLYILTKVSG